MLQIKLKSKGGPSTGGVGAKASAAGEPTTVACPDHLKIADLTVAKSLGSVKQVTASSAVKTLGRKLRPEKGERVHICVRCDYPIAVYGRLSPCEHAFCLQCAKSDSTCFLCDERIQKIQTIKLFEGIWICSAPQCLKSFIKKDEFESHVLGNHGDLLSPCPRKEEGSESEAASARKPTSESTVQAPAKPALSLSSSSLQRDEHAGMQPNLEPPFLGPTPNLVSDIVPDSSNYQGFDRLDAPNQCMQENVGLQGRHTQEYEQFQNSELGVLSKKPVPYNAIQFHQPPDNPNLFPIPPPFNNPQFGQNVIPLDGSPFQQRQDSAPDGEQWQGSMLGFPPRPAVDPVNFLGKSYPQSWGVGQSGGFFYPSLVDRENVDAFKNLSMSDSHGRVAVFQGNFKQNEPSNPALHIAAHKDVEHLSGQDAIEPRDVMGMLPPPPGSHPPHSSKPNRGHYHTGGASHNAQAPIWQPEHQNNS